MVRKTEDQRDAEQFAQALAEDYPEDAKVEQAVAEIMRNVDAFTNGKLTYAEFTKVQRVCWDRIARDEIQAEVTLAICNPGGGS